MLTEQQKNYLSMLLVGDTLTPDEIRRFLARSGWTIEQIDAGIALSIDLKKNTVSDKVSVSSSDLIFTPPQETVVDSLPTTPIAPVRNYNEPITSLDIQPQAKTADLGYLAPSAPPPTFQRSMAMSDMKVPLIQAMPEIQKESPAKQILSFVAWLLFVVFIVMILGLVGYMYYMHIGPFANLTYTKLF